jgi:hypothetical protein
MREFSGLKLYTAAEVAGMKRFGETDIKKGEKYCELAAPWICCDEPLFFIKVADYDIFVRGPYFPSVAYYPKENVEGFKQEPKPACVLPDDASEEELTMYLFHVRSSIKQWQRNHKDSLLGKNAIFGIKAACNTAASGLELSNWVNSFAVGAVYED